MLEPILSQEAKLCVISRPSCSDKACGGIGSPGVSGQGILVCVHDVFSRMLLAQVEKIDKVLIRLGSMSPRYHFLSRPNLINLINPGNLGFQQPGEPKVLIGGLVKVLRWCQRLCNSWQLPTTNSS